MMTVMDMPISADRLVVGWIGRDPSRQSAPNSIAAESSDSTSASSSTFS